MRSRQCEGWPHLSCGVEPIWRTLCPAFRRILAPPWPKHLSPTLSPLRLFHRAHGTCAPESAFQHGCCGSQTLPRGRRTDVGGCYPSAQEIEAFRPPHIANQAVYYRFTPPYFQEERRVRCAAQATIRAV